MVRVDSEGEEEGICRGAGAGELETRIVTSESRKETSAEDLFLLDVTAGIICGGWAEAIAVVIGAKRL